MNDQRLGEKHIAILQQSFSPIPPLLTDLVKRKFSSMPPETKDTCQGLVEFEISLSFNMGVDGALRDLFVVSITKIENGFAYPKSQFRIEKQKMVDHVRRHTPSEVIYIRPIITTKVSLFRKPYKELRLMTLIEPHTFPKSPKNPFDVTRNDVIALLDEKINLLQIKQGFGMNAYWDFVRVMLK